MQSYVGPVWKPDDESNKEKSPPKFLAKRCLRMAIFGQNLATPPGSVLRPGRSPDKGGGELRRLRSPLGPGRTLGTAAAATHYTPGG